MIEWYSREKRSIVDPKFFPLKDLNLVKSGTIVFVKRVYDWMKNAVNNIVLERKKGLVGAPFFVNGGGLGVFQSYFGAPAAVALAELLIAGGVKRLIIFGEAGAVSPNISPGEILVPTFAIREEGTSYHYLPPDVIAKPSKELVEQIEGLLNRLGIPYKEGGVWTTDALFRETRDKVLRFSARGVFAVEMECSALFSVAQYRRAKVAALLIITDKLHEEEWKPAFDNPKVIENEKKISEVLAKHWREVIP